MPQACASLDAVGDFMDVAGRAWKATISMENAQKNLGHALGKEPSSSSS